MSFLKLVFLVKAKSSWEPHFSLLNHLHWISQHAKIKIPSCRETEHEKTKYKKNWKARAVLPSICMALACGKYRWRNQEGWIPVHNHQPAVTVREWDNAVQGKEETKALPLSFFSMLLLSEGWGSRGMCGCRGRKTPSHFYSANVLRHVILTDALSHVSWNRTETLKK